MLKRHTGIDWVDASGLKDSLASDASSIKQYQLVQADPPVYDWVTIFSVIPPSPIAVTNFYQSAEQSVSPWGCQVTVQWGATSEAVDVEFQFEINGVEQAGYYAPGQSGTFSYWFDHGDDIRVRIRAQGTWGDWGAGWGNWSSLITLHNSNFPV